MPSKDFSRAIEDVSFTIDGDTFHCVARIPGGLLLDIAQLENAPRDKQLAVLTDFIDMALLPESAKLFAERMRDTANPIDLGQALDVVVWLIEEVHVDRPTKGSSPSQES